MFLQHDGYISSLADVAISSFGRDVQANVKKTPVQTIAICHNCFASAKYRTIMNRLERALSSSSALDDDAPYSCTSRGSECFDMDMDEEEALRKAARAGIQLLEANKALNEEVTALREQVAVLEHERPKLNSHLKAREQELASVTENRKDLLMEASMLHNELKAKSALVTDLLEKEDLLKQQVVEAEAAKTLADNQITILQLELGQLKADTAKAEAAEQNYAVVNPAATYDSNQASVFTYADYEELQHRLHTTLEENEAHTLEVKSLRKEVDTLRRKVAKLPECIAHIERLEKRNEKLQSTNDTLREERMEEQAVLDSLRSMNLVYKKIAESRPFAADCTCAQQPEESDPQILGVTVRDVLIETNMKLESDLRELRATMKLPHLSENAEVEVLEQALKRVGSNSSNGSAGSDTTISSGESMESVIERLTRKLQIITEKYNLSKEMLRHTKVQWCAAVASQKALEECNVSAQEEISRLTHQLDYHVEALAGMDVDKKEKQIRALVDEDEGSKWTEETAPFPAPPGDLNSPLIRCLLDHWSTDKSKVMGLTDWLHNSIRGTGRATPLRLANLSSEIAAGFTQLLVPIMRERHGVSVSIYRRDSVHVLSDLVLQTNHPSVTVQSFSTAASKDKGVPTHPQDPEECSESELDSVSCRTRGSSGDSILMKGEAQGHLKTMLTDKQQLQSFSSPSSSRSASIWNTDSIDVSTLLFHTNFLESTVPETFLELDPAGFFTHSNSSSATKGSCVSSGFGRTPSPRTANNCWLEPSREPCTDDIPWPDLVFWLGNASTGEVVCSCAQCSRRAMNGDFLRQYRYSPYQQQQQQRRRVSSRVPVINMPRIEGVN
ncbi:hypothetical protein P3T76_007041 [Phytophthora citrophthora]|uniref:Uncharacterized protein n=1 Tax=Phytophthora citrophthora TaxID=4793 RepID=A0AAD9GMJ3_9STRA|nr:hypothetical protein P3T76_007041 [Phytophthora citrophthora]